MFWGEIGTNGQHVLYQLIHQGTQLIPADFTVFAAPHHTLSDEDGTDQHELFLDNFSTQTRTLAFRKTAEEVRTEDTPGAVIAAHVFPDNKPATPIVTPELTPSTPGQLITLYGHIIFVQGAVWGIDSYNQWNVGLGKQTAKDLGPAISGDAEALAVQDSSTASLIGYYHTNRK